jgi:capsular exopolysaccharide synthesis family protein
MSTQLQAFGDANGAWPDTNKVAAVQIWDVVSRNRRFILGSFAISLLGATVLAWRSTPVYESGLSLRIDEKSKGVPVLDVLASLSDRGNELSTEMQMLRSRTLAEATVDSLGLQVSATAPLRLLGVPLRSIQRAIPRGQVISNLQVPRSATPGHYRLNQLPNFAYELIDIGTGKRVTQVSLGQTVNLGSAKFTLAPTAVDYREIRVDVVPFMGAVGSLQRNLSVTRPQRDADFVIVTYQSQDPQMASAVPNALAVNFLELRNRIQKTEARSTVNFLREQIDTLSEQLSSAENAVRAFREGNRVVSVSQEATAQVGELAKLQAQRSGIEAEREALSEALRQARATSERTGGDSTSMYSSLMAFPTLLPHAGQFLQALNEAENQRAILLQRRTREDRDVQILTGRIRELQQQLSSIAQTYLAGLSSQITSIDIALSKFNQQLTRIPSKELQLAKLERQNKVLVEIFTLLQTRLQEAKIAQAVEDSRVRVIDPALIPARPSKPNKPRYLLLGSLFGLLVAIGITVARESMDPTVHMLEDISLATGLSSLGVVPHMQPAKDSAQSELLPSKWRLGGRQGQRRLMGGMAVFDPRNPALEAYRTLRTNITFARPDGNTIRTLVFTSPTPGDGKTTTTANLASTLAHQGLRVLLIDGDMRRGTLNQVFGVSREPGLSNLLVGAAPRSDCIRKIQVGEFGSLDLLPGGAPPPNPSELIGSDRMTKLLDDLRSDYDSIIFDSPPLNLVTDAAVLATKADGVILVGRAGVTTKGGLTYAAELLRKVRAPTVGFVLNDFLFRRDSRYSTYGGYGDYYSYGSYSENGHGKKLSFLAKLLGGSRSVG